MSATALEQLIDRMAGLRVLCVGDLIFDRFIYGTSKQISREAPVPVLDQSRRDLTLGGAGNVARNVTALGGHAILAAVVGDDPEGHVVSSMLTQSDLAEVELVTAKGRSTQMKTRYVAGGQQVLAVDRNPPASLDDQAESELLHVIQSAISECDIVALSDHGGGAMTPAVIDGVIASAKAAGKRVIAEPRGRDFTRYDGVWLLKPNIHELNREAGEPCETDAQVAAGMRGAAARLEAVEYLLVTRGAQGMALLTKDGAEPTFFNATPRDVFDVSGAGDTTIAGLAMALGAGADMAQAIQFANRAAGIVVTKMGTAVVTANEVVADAMGRSIAGAFVGDIAAAAKMAARWRAENARIGLTNGCFDILHAGHVAAIGRARSLCDRLIVGVNADASVRRLKGEGRPLNPQTDRAWVVSALGAVDMVAIFEEDTAIALVEAVKPDVYVKGGDYHSPEDLPETPYVRDHGGEVVLTPFTPGLSTSALIAKLSGSGVG